MPRYLWIPLHVMHTNTPRLMEAHSGSKPSRKKGRGRGGEGGLLVYQPIDSGSTWGATVCTLVAVLGPLDRLQQQVVVLGCGHSTTPSTD